MFGNKKGPNIVLLLPAKQASSLKFHLTANSFLTANYSTNTLFRNDLFNQSLKEMLVLQSLNRLSAWCWT